MLTDKRRRRQRAQRGSVLSSVLIIVAFLSILGGALMNEISGQFLLSHVLASRVANEATVTSSVEYAIGQLQTRSVPVHCSTDTGPSWSINLNGKPATATPICLAIVPDLATSLAGGAFPADGTHVLIAGRDTYLVGDSGGNVYDYNFGQTSLLWRLTLGAGVTGPPVQSPDAARANHIMTLVPVGGTVALVDDQVGAGAAWRCNMAAGGTVTSQPGFEHAPSRSAAYFPNYAFFGDASGRLSVYDATTNGTCVPRASVSGLGGKVVGGPLVLSGTRTTNNNQGEGNQVTTITTVEVFAVTSSGGSSHLVQYEYSEEDDGSGVNRSLSFVDSVALPFASAAGVAFNSTTPGVRNPIRLAVTGSGQVTLGTITASRSGRNRGTGQTYTMSIGPTVNLGGTFRRAPYWCHCPGGNDLIGAGNQNGTLYVLNANNLALRNSYDGAADGRPQINSTPGADANGNWYFGADDGFVYDVEPKASGIPMFKAARFGAGASAPVGSSPVVGTPSDGCAPGACVYFGSTSTSYFAQLGGLRLMDLTACLSAQPCSAASTTNPRLWARLEVGTPGIVGGHDVNIVGWSYYSP